jgi:hypothetical protein
MKMEEWLRAGYDPPFGTVDEWITDQLGRAGAEELAAYALWVREGSARVVRIIVASDEGLFDFHWHRPAKVEDRRLHGRHYAWWEVRGLVLEGENRVDPETLTHGEPHWAIRAEWPELVIENGPSDEAALDLWRVCHDQIRKARAPKAEG